MHKDDLIELYVGKELSTYEIAELKNVHNTTVFRWLKKYDIPTRTQKEAWTKRARPDWIEQLPILVKSKNAQDIAELYGIKYHTVQYHIKKMGLTGKRVSEGMLNKREQTRTRYTKEILYDLYHTQNLTLGSIGKRYNVTAATVLADMKRFDIPRRSKTEASTTAWDSVEKREAARQRAIARGDLQFGQRTDIELMFEQWAAENDVQVVAQFQLSEIGHRYDYHIIGTNILIELDGDYWHSTSKQQTLDHRFELEAEGAGFTVVRFLRSALLKDSSIFNQLLR